MTGVTHHIAGDQTNILDIPYPADGTGFASGTVHARRIEFHYTLFVGESAESDRLIIRIVFLRLGHMQHGIKCVLTVLEHLPSLIDRGLACDLSDDHWLLGFWQFPLLGGLGRRLIPILSLNDRIAAYGE